MSRRPRSLLWCLSCVFVLGLVHGACSSGSDVDVAQLWAGFDRCLLGRLAPGQLPSERYRDLQLQIAPAGRDAAADAWPRRCLPLARALVEALERQQQEDADDQGTHEDVKAAVDALRANLDKSPVLRGNQLNDLDQLYRDAPGRWRRAQPPARVVAAPTVQRVPRGAFAFGPGYLRSGVARPVATSRVFTVGKRQVCEFGPAEGGQPLRHVRCRHLPDRLPRTACDWDRAVELAASYAEAPYLLSRHHGVYDIQGRRLVPAAEGMATVAATAWRDGSLAVLFARDEGFVLHRSGGAALRLGRRHSVHMVGPYLIWQARAGRQGKVLHARRVLPELRETEVLGPAPTLRLRACDGGGTFFLYPSVRRGRSLLFARDREGWHRLTGDFRGVAACTGGAITFTHVDGEPPGIRLRHVRCSSSGCHSEQRRLQVSTKPQGIIGGGGADAISAIGVQGAVLLVWLADGVRLRSAATLAKLAGAEERVIFDNGTQRRGQLVHGLGLLARDGVGLVLLQVSEGQIALRVDARASSSNPTVEVLREGKR